MRFEYKQVKAVDLQGSTLNELGSQGWELVAIHLEKKSTGGANDTWIFKRALDAVPVCIMEPAP